MPFTLSHPAAVLPLAGTGFPVAALVAGSMAPDVPMFTTTAHATGGRPRLAGRSAPVAIGTAALLELPEGFHAVAFHGAVVGTVALSLLMVAVAW
jgi:hypothetical protein